MASISVVEAYRNYRNHVLEAENALRRDNIKAKVEDRASYIETTRFSPDRKNRSRSKGFGSARI